MDSITYKVIFKAIQHIENKNLTLSFKNLAFQKPLAINSKSILKLKNLSEKSEKIIFFQNIEEVIIVGNINPNIDYNYYMVVLSTLKSSGEKQGYLIGNVKNIGDIIIGVWLFNKQISELTYEIILEKYNDIIKNPDKYSKICLISQ